MTAAASPGKDRRFPLTVAYFSNTGVRGGAEEHILTLLRGLDRTRFRTTWICPPSLAEQVKPDVPSTTELIRLQLDRPQQWAAASRLASLLRVLRPEILHSHLFCASRYASPIGRVCSVPVVIETPHIREHWRRGWKRSYFIDRVIGRTVDYYIAVSEANGRYLEQEKGLPRHKIVVIQNGCDLRRFRPATAVQPGPGSEFGIEPGDPVLLVMARLEPQKGHRILLAAMAEVVRSFPRVRVICLGDGALRQELESERNRLSLQSNVHFAGRRADMQDWLAIATATVLPSFYEGLPLAAMESLAAARAVIATCVDGTPEIVRDGLTGLLCAPGNPMQLAQVILQALRDPESCRRWGRQGRDWIEQKFDERRQLERTQALYEKAWSFYQARAGCAPVGRHPLPGTATESALRTEADSCVAH